MASSLDQSKGAIASEQAEPARLLAVLAVGVLAISFAALFFRQAAPTHPLAAAGLRLCMAAVLLVPLVCRAVRAGRVDRRFLALAVLAGLCYGAHFGTWVASLGMAGVAASVTLVTATPLCLAGVALVQGRDRPDPRHWLALGLAVLGVGIIGAADLSASSEALAGDAMALAGALAMAGYMLAARRLGRAIDPWAFMGIAAAVGAVALFATGLALGVDLAPASPKALGFLVLSALVPQLVGHTALTWALRHARPTVVGLATVGEPVGATLWAYVWLAETPSTATAAGCLVTMAAVALALRPRAPRVTA